MSKDYVPGTHMVVTSINPNFRLAYQTTCFRKWKKLGYKCLAFQGRQEADLLLQAGFEQDDLFILDDTATGGEMHDVPSPRIKPILQILQSDFRPRSVILTNGDIFPAVRKRMDALVQLAPCLAMTRCDVISQQMSYRRANSSNRKALDIFVLNEISLQRLWNKVERSPVADRMAYGVPGWDYYFGSLLLDKDMGGIFMDAYDLCHIPHKPSHQNADELRYYLKSMRDHVGKAGRNDAHAAAIFTGIIAAQCSRHSGYSKLVSSMYRDPIGVIGEDVASRLLVDERFLTREVVGALGGPNDIQGLEDYVLSEDFSMGAVRDHLCTSRAYDVRFNELLACTYSVLFLLSTQGRFPRKVRRSTNGPYKSKIRKAMAYQDAARVRYELLDVFITTLIENGVYLENLHKYAALSCINDTERKFLSQITTILKEQAYDQAA